MLRSCEDVVERSEVGGARGGMCYLNLVYHGDDTANTDNKAK